MLESKAKNSEFLQITRHDKFYSRLLSKENSSSAPSFRVYYGGASGAVPFLWESQPGTPKNTIQANTLPPLTPPPSYNSNSKRKQAKKTSPKASTLMHCILPKLITSRSSNLLSLSPSVSSSRSSGSRSSFSSDEGSPNSTLCYRIRRGGSGGDLRGCNSMVIMKNALLTIVGGRGSNQGTTAAKFLS